MGHEISGRLLKGMSKFRGYTVVKPVGIGGEGEVWLVHHDVLHVDFAVKVVPKSVMDADPDLRSQFAVEARISGKVRHPSLVSVYDAGFDEPTGLYYLVMDYMPGGNIARRLSIERRFSVRKAASIVRTIAKGIAELKRLGVVHRDVKPMNMLVAANGDVRLSDFGIALFLDSPPSDERADLVVGTPLYLPYEQIADSMAVDNRADVYALGVSFFEMLAGTCPGAELTPNRLMEERLDGKRLPDIRTVNKAIPENVAQLIYRMTDPDADKRLGDPMAVVAELDAIFGKSTFSKSGSAPGRRRMNALVAVSLIALFATLILAVVRAPVWVAAYMEGKEPKNQETPETREMPGPPSTWLDRQSGERHSPTETIMLEEPLPQPEPPQHRPEPPQPQPEPPQPKPEPPPPKPEPPQPKPEPKPEQEPEPQPEPQPPQSATEPEPPPKVEKWQPPKTIPWDELPCEMTVCGIRIESVNKLEKDVHSLSNCIALADRAVRRLLMPSAGGKRVQNAIDRISIVEKCDGKNGSKKVGNSLEIGCEVVCSSERIEKLVAAFMTSDWKRSVDRSPFFNDEYCRYIFNYVTHRIRDMIARDRGRGTGWPYIMELIKHADDTAIRHGMCGPDGKRERNGVMMQCIPDDELPAYREGKVFFVLRSAEKISEAAIRDYFRIRNSEYVKWNMTDGKMSDSDFVGVLSKAVGKDLFGAMSQEGWKGIKRDLSRVKVDRLEKVAGFDM